MLGNHLKGSDGFSLHHLHRELAAVVDLEISHVVEPDFVLVLLDAILIFFLFFDWLFFFFLFLILFVNRLSRFLCQFCLLSLPFGLFLSFFLLELDFFQLIKEHLPCLCAMAESNWRFLVLLCLQPQLLKCLNKALIGHRSKVVTSLDGDGAIPNELEGLLDAAHQLIDLALRELNDYLVRLDAPSFFITWLLRSLFDGLDGLMCGHLLFFSLLLFNTGKSLKLALSVLPIAYHSFAHGLELIFDVGVVNQGCFISVKHIVLPRLGSPHVGLPLLLMYVALRF